jgi:DnaJ-class molecular chaperone
MPIFEGTGHGDLFITYNVVLPNSLTEEVKQSQSDYSHCQKFMLIVHRFKKRIIRGIYEACRCRTR